VYNTYFTNWTLYSSPTQSAIEWTPLFSSFPITTTSVSKGAHESKPQRLRFGLWPLIVYARAIKCMPPLLAQSSTHPNHHHPPSPPPPFLRAHTNPSPGGSDSNFGPTCAFHGHTCPHHPTTRSTTSHQLPSLPSMAIFTVCTNSSPSCIVSPFPPLCNPSQHHPSVSSIILYIIIT